MPLSIGFVRKAEVTITKSAKSLLPVIPEQSCSGGKMNTESTISGNCH